MYLLVYSGLYVALMVADVLTGTDVRLVVSGHYHHEMSGSIAGIPVHVVPGIADVVDPLGPRDRARALALSGASLVELTGERSEEHTSELQSH